MLQMFSLHSPDNSYDEKFLSNYININLKPAIQRISGVGDLIVLGSDYSMRVWMKPDIMAQYKLIPADVTRVLAEQNIEAATGSFGENSDETFQYTMKYKGRLLQPEEFGDIVIKSTENGEVLKLKDIADIEMGKDSYAYVGRMDGHEGVSCMIFQTAGSNATEVNNQINALLEEAKKICRKVLKSHNCLVPMIFVCLYQQRRENTDRGHHPGYSDSLSLPSGFPFYADSVGGYCRLAYRNLRLHVYCRLQYQHDHAVCFSAGYRYGSR